MIFVKVIHLCYGSTKTALGIMSAKRDDHAAMILFIKTSGEWDVTSKCNLPTLPKKKRMHLSTAFKTAAKFSKN